jgi:hypothetical protein
MARKSLIAEPLWAERYQNKLVCLHAIKVIIKNTKILHYQGFSGHIPAGQ